MRLYRNQKGFTLFELIIVIAILGILALVLYPKMQGRETTAKIQACEMEMLKLYEAAEAWKLNHGKANFNGLTMAALNSENLWDSSKKNPWGSVYSLSINDAGCADCSVRINSGTLPDGNIRTMLNDRLSVKGYTALGYSDPIRLVLQAPY